jgi:single-stranded-DNA-specific exonuclease
VDQEAFERYKQTNSRAAGVFLNTLKQEETPVAVVHHNDADGLCAAASLARVFGMLRIEYRLLAVEKIHDLILRSIHAANPGCLIYADLGGQSSGIIGGYALQNRLVIILDHHLPGGETGGNLIHLNPEHFGISGDTEISGAGVAALFAREVLRQSAGAVLEPQSATRHSGPARPYGEAEDGQYGKGEPPGILAAFGIIGAFGDNQLSRGALSGVNEVLLAEAIELNLVHETPVGLTCRPLGDRAVGEIVETLNLLGSIGFYSGEVRKGIDFLLGRSQAGAVRAAAALSQLKTHRFAYELKRIGKDGLHQSGRIQWLDVKSRFLPMGVKAIGLFLEELVAQGLADETKYVVGFQHFPESVPMVGELGVSLTKVSARVPPQLRRTIERGRFPDLMKLIPEATRELGGIADGCHRFSAASLIERGKEREFVEALEGAAGRCGAAARTVEPDVL